MPSRALRRQSRDLGCSKAMLMRYENKQRHGVTALLAMIFLVLFATLAVGFYASTTQTTVIATNEKNGVISLTAAESGMDFIRYQLALIKVPPTDPPLTVARPLEVTLRSPPMAPPVTRIAGAEPFADMTLAMLLAAPPVAPTVPFCISTPPWAAMA